MFRPGWSSLPVPALAAFLVTGACVTGGLSLAGFRAGEARAQIQAQILAQAAPGFLTVAEDVPLMPGLAESADAATVFDKPSGRIASTEARGNLSAAAVRQFYAATLPQLGWQAQSSELYRRDREQLRLGFAGRDGALVVRFELLPSQ